MFGISKAHLHTAAVVAATIVLIAAFQRNIAPIPVVGSYLPK